MEILKEHLRKLIQTLSKRDRRELKNRLDDLISVYPFNDYEYVISSLQCCDVFVWVGVWRDTIKYWVLSSKEVQNNKYYSKGQHRGNVGEGQLHLNHDNIKEFQKYLCQSNTLLDKIIKAYKRQNTKRGI